MSIFFFFIVASICFLTIISPAANNDNNFFSPITNVRSAPIESELLSGSFIDTNDGLIITDEYFAEKVWGYSKNNLKQFSPQELIKGDFSGSSDELIVVRDYILKNSFLAYNGFYKLDFDLQNVLENQFSEVYNSGSVHDYIRS